MVTAPFQQAIAVGAVGGKAIIKIFKTIRYVLISPNNAVRKNQKTISGPLVTIGIPTYNRAQDLLPLAVQSALDQTYKHIEIIVSDNGSSDQTRDVVRKLGNGRVKYFFQSPHLEPNDNFNFCLNQASGDYFLLLHDDDLIDTRFVTACMEAAQYRAHFGLIRTGVRTIDGSGSVLMDYPNDDQGLSAVEFVAKWLKGQSMLVLCGNLFNTRYLKEAGSFGSKHHLFQDVYAEILLATRYGRLDVKEIAASFRKHGGQRTNGARVREWCEDSVFLLNKIAELFPGDEAGLRRLGEIHFSKHNYDLAKGIKNPVDRYRMYLYIYRLFSRQYSPPKYFYKKNRRALFAALGRNKRNLLKMFRR